MSKSEREKARERIARAHQRIEDSKAALACTQEARMLARRRVNDAEEEVVAAREELEAAIRELDKIAAVSPPGVNENEPPPPE